LWNIHTEDYGKLYDIKPVFSIIIKMLRLRYEINNKIVLRTGVTLGKKSSIPTPRGSGARLHSSNGVH
jgi:hypothetical protein